MTFKQRLAEAGATDQQIQSKIASICEGVVAEMGADEVMMSAIEAGSYGVWRSIMGEKHNPYKSGKKVRY